MGGQLNIYPRPARDSFELGHRARKEIAKQFELLESQGWPLRARSGRLVDGSDTENHWYEYIPSSYDGSSSVPLVISFHAGHYFASAQVFDTCWCEIAEREGFIVAFPEATSGGCFTTSEGTGYLDANRIDVRFVDALLDSLERRFNIDSTRIYLHGMSRGGIFAAELSLYFGTRFAALGISCGSGNPDVLEQCKGDALLHAVSMPVVHLCCAYDVSAPHRGHTAAEIGAYNRRFWLEANGCTEPPQIKVTSFELIAYYRGLKADYVFRDSAFHNHYESVSDAEDCWSLFRTARRLPDGSIQRTGEPSEFVGDAHAIAVGDFSSHAFVGGKPVRLSAKVRQYRDVNVRRRGGFQDPIRGEAVAGPLDGMDMRVYYYAHVADIARLFGLECGIEGEKAFIVGPDGERIGFVKGSSAAVIRNRVHSMGQAAREVEGAFCIPLDWFAEQVMDKCTAQKDGILYIADRQVVMTEDFATIIREQIGWGA